MLNSATNLAVAPLEWWKFLTKIVGLFLHHARIPHSSQYFATVNAYLLNAQQHPSIGRHAVERTERRLEV